MDVLASFFSHLDFDSVQNFLGEATKHSIVDWTMKIGIVWMIMGRKVNARFSDFEISLAAHFKAIEAGFENLVGEMKELKDNVTTDLTKHSTQLGSLAVEVGNIKTRVEKLETKGE